MCFRHCGRSGRRVEDCCGTHDSGLYRQDLSAARSSSVGSCMPTTTCDDLAQFYLADWWIVCPLRFRAVG